MSKLEDRYLGEENVTVTNDVSGMYDPGQDNSKKLEQYAEENGLRLVIAAENELLIDLDTEQGYELFKDQVEVLRQFMDVLGVQVAPSKSGLPHRHCTVKIRVPANRQTYGIPTIHERLALQAMLGSDRRCELLRYMRWTFGDPHPILFLEKM